MLYLSLPAAVPLPLAVLAMYFPYLHQPICVNLQGLLSEHSHRIVALFPCLRPRDDDTPPQQGRPEHPHLEEVPAPQPAAHEVVIRLKAAALNHCDVRSRSGSGTSAAANLGHGRVILSSDGADEVVAMGSGVDQALVGRAVVINPSLIAQQHMGSDAERKLCLCCLR